MLTQAATDDRVAAVRAFNRLYTDVIGVLGEGLLETPYSSNEARAIFELAQRENVEVAELRAELHLDQGYLSRTSRWNLCRPISRSHEERLGAVGVQTCRTPSRSVQPGHSSLRFDCRHHVHTRACDCV